MSSIHLLSDVRSCTAGKIGLVLKLLELIVEEEKERRKIGFMPRVAILILRSVSLLSLWASCGSIYAPHSDDILEDEEEPWFLQRNGTFDIMTYTDLWGSLGLGAWPELMSKDLIVTSSKVSMVHFKLERT